MATVSFNGPSYDGGTPISSYVVSATDITNPHGEITEGVPASSPDQVRGVVRVGKPFGGDSYTFGVAAANAIGTGPESAPSRVVTILSTVGKCTPLTCRPIG